MALGSASHWEEVTLEELCWGHPCSFSFSLKGGRCCSACGLRDLGLCSLPQNPGPAVCFFFLSCRPFTAFSHVFSLKKEMSLQNSKVHSFCCVCQSTYNFPHQGLNLSPCSGSAESQSLNHQGSPKVQSPNPWPLKRTWFL